MRDGQEPWSQGATDPQSPGLAGQDEEGRLERVLGRVRIVEDSMARPVDHWAMTLHQDREGQLGGHPVVARKHLKELAIGLLSDRPTIEERLDVLKKGPLTILHLLPLPDGLSRHLLIMGLGRTITPTFSEEKTSHGNQAGLPRVPARRHGGSVSRRL